MSNKKILIIGPAWIGDMVMAQTLFKLIKEHKPQTELHILAPAWTLSLLEFMPEISNSFLLPIGHGELALGKRYKLAKKLRTINYDQAIVLPGSFKSALIPWWAKIPVRTGWRKEMRYGLLNDLRILDKTKFPLMIQRYAALGLAKGEPLPEHLPWPKLEVDEKAALATLEKYRNRIEDCGLRIEGTQGSRLQANILALCPGAEFGPSKRWPTRYFAEVTQHQLAKNWQVWIFGGPKDQPLAKEIQELANNRCIDFTGKTTIQEAIQLISLTTATITNDSGLMHIAAALDKPLIATYGSTSPDFTPPLSDQAKILSLTLPCRPCFKRECPLKHHQCMENLKPKLVIGALEKIYS